MANKLLVIITAGENEIYKFRSAVSISMNIKKKSYMDDVKVVFFGPSEKLLASDNAEILNLFKDLKNTGIEIFACKNVSDNFSITPKLIDLGLNVTLIGKIVTDLLKDGYIPLTF